MRYNLSTLLAIWLLLVSSLVVAQESERARPFILASIATGSIAEQAPAVIQALENAGFEVVGDYTPYQGAQILIITNDYLKKQAAASEFGGYGAALRVSLTENQGQFQISYTNPVWMGNVYRMNGDFTTTLSELQQTLGAKQDFGSEGGRTLSNLREYHYMMFMPYFDDQVLLASYDSHQAALDAVEKGLANKTAGVGKVARVDLAGKEESLFAVSIQSGAGADEPVMAIIDQGDLRHTAHLPYEMLVSGNNVYMLHGKFRIAQSFPDLTMTTFMKISDAPDAIETALKQAAGEN